MDLGLKGKVALVTCAGRGLGSACARQLLNEGVEVFGVRRTLPHPGLDNQAPIHWLIGDLTSTDTLLKQLESLISQLDIIVYVPVREKVAPFASVSVEEYRTAMEYTFFFYAALLKMALPTMIDKGYGRFINLVGASVLAPLYDHTLSNVVRASILSLCSGAAREYAAYGITFNTIVLGLFETRGLERLWTERAEGNPERLMEYGKYRVSEIPRKRLGDPGECAKLCALLASPAMSYINGQTIRLDGGKQLGL